MLKKLVPLICFLVLGAPLNAKEQKVVKGSQEIEKNSVEEIKSASNFYAGIEAFIGIGGVLGYKHNDELSFELYLQTIPKNNLLIVPIMGYYKTSTTLSGYITGARMRYFLTDSFNLVLGGAYRDMIKHETTRGVRGKEDSYREIPSQGFLLETRIGHQWRWQHFYLGVDWIGWAFPDQPILLRPSLGFIF